MDDDTGFLRAPHFLDALLLVIGYWTFLILSLAYVVTTINALTGG